MSRIKPRVPGRYERPAALRPALGDVASEAGIRAGYGAAILARQNARDLDARYARGEIDEKGRPRELVGVATVEAAAGTLEHVEVHEASSGGVKAGKKPATVTIDIIRSGWNSSGSRYYPADVLERDVPNVYPAGTHMYIDHPSMTEAEDRPERSLQTLAAVFVDTPYAVREGDQVVMRTTARVYSRWKDFLSEAQDDIGVSINGSGDGEYATREGRAGLVLERLTHGASVDFVTKPGAGGRIVALLESARPFESPEFRAALDKISTREAASLGAWLESQIHVGFTQLADGLYGDGRLTRPERIAASSAIGDALGAFVAGVEKNAPELYKRGRYDDAPGDPAGAGPDVDAVSTQEASVEAQRCQLDQAVQTAYSSRNAYAYVRDFDPDRGVVWFSAGGDGTPSKTWQQGYTTVNAAVQLAGERQEVRERTVYDPVGAITSEAAARKTPADAIDQQDDQSTAQVVDAGGAQVDPEPGDADADDPDEYGAGTRKRTAEAHTQTPEAAAAAPGSTADEAITAKESTMTDSVKDAATREAEEATRTREAIELAQYRQADKARGLLDAKLAESSLPAIAQNRVRAQFPATALPLVEADRTLDTARFTTTLEAAIKAEGAYVAELLEANGVGTVTGNGAAAGAGSGIPAGFGAQRNGVATTEAAATATTEALKQEYMSRGLPEAAAARAAAGRN
jgi:hypothetical protein